MSDHPQPTDPEREVAFDMAKLGLIVGPVLIAISSIIWRLEGLASSSLAFALVVLNLVIGATIIAKTAPISPTVLMGAVLGGFLLRLVTLSLIVLPIRDLSWFEVGAFGLTLVCGHLGLLIWETQRVSASLAFPGLPPKTSSPVAAGSARRESQ